MARPPKPAAALKQNNDVCRKTKAELAIRERAEAALLTGAAIIETPDVAGDPIAHNEFMRLLDVMGNIGKNDELYGAPARRYCLNASQLAMLNEDIKALRADMNEAKDFETRNKARNAWIRENQLAAQIRNEMVKFENDNGMTVAASLRMIPKKPEEVKDPLLEILNS